MSKPEQGPPPRLLDDPSSSARVRNDLSNVTQAATSYDAAAGLVALQAVIGTAKIAGAGSAAVGAGGSASTSIPAAAAKTALAIKAALIGGVSVIAIAGAVAVSSIARDEAPRTPATRAATHQQGTPPPAPATRAVEPAPIAAPAVTPPPSIEPALIEPAVMEPAVARASSSAEVPRDRAAAEIAQLARIKASIEREPARALRLAEQGNREFSNGYLHHEREGLAIIAMHALGRRDEARARAARYLARYPHSPLTDRVRALGDESSAQ